MAEPATSGVVGVAGWKLLGGLAGVFALAAGLASLVVMCMTPPRHAREWIVGLVSTVMGSIGGGSVAIHYFGLQAWAQDPMGLAALLGVAFACGLPGWTLVRAVFTYLERQKGRGIDEIVQDVRSVVAQKQQP